MMDRGRTPHIGSVDRAQRILADHILVFHHEGLELLGLLDLLAHRLRIHDAAFARRRVFQNKMRIETFARGSLVGTHPLTESRCRIVNSSPRAFLRHRRAGTRHLEVAQHPLDPPLSAQSASGSNPLLRTS